MSTIAFKKPEIRRKRQESRPEFDAAQKARVDAHAKKQAPFLKTVERKRAYEGVTIKGVKMLSVKELVDKYGTTASCIGDLRRRCGLPAIKVGRYYFYDEEKVLTWFSENGMTVQ